MSDDLTQKEVVHLLRVKDRKCGIVPPNMEAIHDKLCREDYIRTYSQLYRGLTDKEARERGVVISYEPGFDGTGYHDIAETVLMPRGAEYLSGARLRIEPGPKHKNPLFAIRRLIGV